MLWRLSSSCLLILSFSLIYFEADAKLKNTDNIKVDSDDFLNGRIANEVHPFRTKKVNLLWEKAKGHVGGEKMEDLYTALLKHDKESLSLKNAVYAGLDEDGSLQAEHKAKLQKILYKYHLEDVLPEEWLKDAGAGGNEVREELPELAGSRKLNDLYVKAKERGFSDLELKNLREELGHHKKRMDEWDVLKDDVVKQKMLASNSLDPTRDSEDSETLRDKRRKLTLQHERIKKDYDELHQRVNNGSKGNHFSEGRVAELWSLAQGANFSEDELISLKEELGHFEHRVRKQRVLTDDARVAEAKALQLDEEQRKHPDAEHNVLWQRVQSYSHKVRKSYNELRHRIEKQTRQHGSEL